MVVFVVVYRSPGAGVAFASVIGRYEFPQRGDFAVMPAAPLVVLIAFIGIAVADRRVLRLKAPEPAVVVGLIAAVGCVSAVVRGTSADDLAFERLMLLTLYIAPLVLLAGSLSEAELVRFRVWLVRLAVVLGLLTLLIGSADQTGRAAALGGGPIPLAQLCMIALLLVVGFRDDLVPVSLSERAQSGTRIGSAGLLLLVAMRTASRFPVLAVAVSMVIVLLVVAAYQRDLVRSAATAAKKAPVVVPSLIAVGYFAIAVAGRNTIDRFGLLTNDLSGELERSRGQLFRHSWNESISALPFGYGPGNFARYDFGGSAPPVTYPHNLILEVIGDYGIPGLAIMLYLLAITFVSAENSRADRRYVALAAYGLTIAMTSGDIAHNRYFFVFAAVLVLSRRTSATGRAAAPRPLPLAHAR